MTTYSYPASFRPCSTKASAVSRTRASLMSGPNVFQLFHPIGGVRASMVLSLSAREWMQRVKIAPRTPGGN